MNEALKREGIDGNFAVAFWVPDGNDGPHGFDGGKSHVLNCMIGYVPPKGFIEMKIPEECFC